MVRATLKALISDSGAEASEQDIEATLLDPEDDSAQQLDTPTIVSPTNLITDDKKSSQGGGIALALGGGAARGWAHIGVLRAFDDANIPIKMIAGTSIGALVGGCYLSGKLDELEDFARSITKRNILRFMDFSIRSSGLISGERLAKRMGPHLDGILLEQMDRDFISVATDIQTGHEIWLNDGPIIPAMRASYALPGVFKPVWHNNRLLVDGALVNPVPVSACRSSEPNIVIAVNLNSETFGKGTVIRSSHYDGQKLQEPEMPEPQPEAVNQAVQGWFSFLAGQRAAPGVGGQLDPASQSKIGVTGVMMEAFNIIQDRISRSRLAGDPPDYTIRPRLKTIGWTEFHKADESIRLGYEEGKLRINELQRIGELEKAISS